ncbi:MAG: hypothetical protein A3D95_13875 [Betaproteobacteria bacterium RIFCSPHIGHO2_12_FULL_69_13]|nr:MAG: hypothetical protein A3D95_13875 [Betaproteobacteria bacterium RIFCSPHIGHO2_12_FULL_69_13]OGA66541.1 MAG: hypothetical protein A3G83_09305 [Betaproteobacteria bacterium RIFCSPLOWO2_12_FULL_68_20]
MACATVPFAVSAQDPSRYGDSSPGMGGAESTQRQGTFMSRILGSAPAPTATFATFPTGPQGIDGAAIGAGETRSDRTVPPVPAQ